MYDELHVADIQILEENMDVSQVIEETTCILLYFGEKDDALIVTHLRFYVQ